MARDEFERNKDVKDIVSLHTQCLRMGGVDVMWWGGRVLQYCLLHSELSKPGIGFIETEANDEGTVTDQIPHINGEITVGCHGAIHRRVMRSPSSNPGPYHTKQQSADRRKNI